MIIYVFGARDIYIFNESLFETSEYIRFLMVAEKVEILNLCM